MLCQGGVIGADTSATSVLGQFNITEQPTHKIEIVDGRTIVACSGSIGLAQRFSSLCDGYWLMYFSRSLTLLRCSDKSSESSCLATAFPFMFSRTATSIGSLMPPAFTSTACCNVHTVANTPSLRRGGSPSFQKIRRCSPRNGSDIICPLPMDTYETPLPWKYPKSKDRTSRPVTLLFPAGVCGFPGDLGAPLWRYFLHTNFGRCQPTLAAESHGSRILVGYLAVLGLVDYVLENAES